MSREKKYIEGTLLDEEHLCSLGELCRVCGISAEIVHDMVEEGLVCQRGHDPRKWHFTLIEVRRIQTAVRLQRDLRVNLPGCALALDLLEEIEALQRRLHRR